MSVPRGWRPPRRDGSGEFGSRTHLHALWLIKSRVEAASKWPGIGIFGLYRLCVELASIGVTPTYLPTPATLTYHKRKVCRRFGDRLTFSVPGLAAVSLAGDSGKDSGGVSVIGSAPGSTCVRVFETAIQIRQVDGVKELPQHLNS